MNVRSLSELRQFAARWIAENSLKGLAVVLAHVLVYGVMRFKLVARSKVVWQSGHGIRVRAYKGKRGDRAAVEWRCLARAITGLELGSIICCAHEKANARIGALVHSLCIELYEGKCLSSSHVNAVLQEAALELVPNGSPILSSLSSYSFWRGWPTMGGYSTRSSGFAWQWALGDINPSYSKIADAHSIRRQEG